MAPSSAQLPLYLRPVATATTSERSACAPEEKSKCEKSSVDPSNTNVPP